MPGTSACPRADEWECYLLGQIPESDGVRLDRHLASCAACLAVVTSIRTVGDPLSDSIASAIGTESTIDAEVDEELIARVCRLARAAPVADAAAELAELLEPPQAVDELGRVGPYGILRVLGRGGMGIVFAARQDRPRRVVALKMLHTATRGGRDRLERFRAESEVLARLSHPQVVRVLAVGEHRGRPYFTTEYAEGGSLAQQLANATLAPRAAAELVHGLAHTVAAAHAQGIVHRDLKPSNVLLAGDGTPLIADFGLAKQLAGAGAPDASPADESPQTETGAILGTPSYMAPEQATGANENIGPAIDVYALGAILYETLTGRPPFKAATLLETLDQVRSQDPVPPRRLQPGVPRDLDTICLTCLQKQPAQRYASAAALADDLQRWCEGRPIRARRTGPVERLLKWARRRPALAALAAVCVLSLAGLLGGAAVYEARLRTALHETAEQKERADANYREARATLRQMLARASARSSSDVPRLRELQREQEEDALAFFLKIAQQQGDDPEVRLDVAQACLEVGVLQMKLGQKQPARANLHRAREALEELAAEFPERQSYRYELTRVLLTLVASGLLAPDEARTYLEQCLAQADQLLTENSQHPDYRAAKATILMHLGTWYLAEPVNVAVAEDHLTKAVALWEEVSRARPEERMHRLMLADTLCNLSLLQQKHGRDPAAAHDRAEAVLQQLHGERPDDEGVLSSLTGLRVNWAYVQMARGKLDEAQRALAANVQLLAKALEAEPQHTGLRDRLLRSHGVRAQVLDQQKRFAEAAEDRQRVVELCASVAAADYQRLFLAMSRARANQLAAAARVLDEWTTRVTPTTPADQVLYATGVYCIVLDALPRDRDLPAAERDALGERCGKQAVALLTRLVGRGYFRDAAHARVLATDEDLLPLRGRADFAKLLAQVKQGMK